jgi:hypothetical protein
MNPHLGDVEARADQLGEEDSSYGSMCVVFVGVYVLLVVLLFALLLLLSILGSRRGVSPKI